MMAAGVSWRDERGIATEEESIAVMRMLLAQGVDVDERNAAGETGLHGAAGRGAAEVIRFLVASGSDLRAKDNTNRTPLHVAMGISDQQLRLGGGAAMAMPVRESAVKVLRELMEANGVPIETYTRPAMSDQATPQQRKILRLSMRIIFFAIALCALCATPAAAQDSVFLEELTWTELRDAMRQGTTTVIIPTGGTEQGGPHLVLGKHNFVMKVTVAEIARRLGHTLVAPVMAYVPEGDINPATGHMRRPGTIHSSARALRQGRRICRPEPEAARVPRHHPHRRQRR